MNFVLLIIGVTLTGAYLVLKTTTGTHNSCTSGTPPSSIAPRAYVVLALLAEFNGELQSKQRLQKLVFLIDEELGTDHQLFAYTKYDYGPYAHQLDTDSKHLERVGFIKIDKTRTLGGNLKYTYVLTEAGENALGNTMSDNALVSEQLAPSIHTVLSDHGDKHSRGLIRTVRESHYDEYWKNSVYRR